MVTRKRALQAVVRSDFRAFLEKTFNTLTPGDTFDTNFHIDAIAFQLERVRRGEIKRLIINMPPRSLKSITASVAFPAYVLGHDPTKRIVAVSYSGELAKKHSNDFRAVIEADWYRETYPSTKIGHFKNTETEIEFTKRGYRLATSVGGTLTGRGGDIIIIDDPLKPDDALSDSRRNAANSWFLNTLLSRLDDKRTGAIVIVMQRVHVDDLTGFVLGLSEGWEVLSLPAIAPHPQSIPIWGGDIYERQAGEPLAPREPIQVLDELKLQLGSDAFSAQYQQSPMPPGGAMVKRHWVQRYDELPPKSEWTTILQSWDTANKGGPDNDWSVCTTWIFARGNRFFLADVLRGKVDYPTLKSKVASHARAWKANRVLVEDAGAGTMLVQEMRGSVSGVIAVKPDRDKITRMSVASAKIEAGQVFLPTRASWLNDLEEELFSFPGSRHDDQCDSISQALLYHKLSFMQQMSEGDRRRLLERTRARAPRAVSF
jgi:predicted phage terminase large subunit-like protein